MFTEWTYETEKRFRGLKTKSFRVIIKIAVTINCENRILFGETIQLSDARRQEKMGPLNGPLFKSLTLMYNTRFEE